MITAAQLRAARGLLDWTRADLAKAAGVSPETIKNIEHGTFRPQESTADAIVRAFKSHDVEFTENEGVRRAKETITVLEGKEGFKTFMDDLYLVAQLPTSINGEKELCTYNVDNDMFRSILGDYAQLHVTRMSRIKNLKIKIITPNHVEPQDGTNYRIYRQLPKSGVDVPFYVYDDKFAIINFDVENPPRIVIISSAVVAQSYRDQFNMMWQIATESAGT